MDMTGIFLYLVLIETKADLRNSTNKEKGKPVE